MSFSKIKEIERLSVVLFHRFQFNGFYYPYENEIIEPLILELTHKLFEVEHLIPDILHQTYNLLIKDEIKKLNKDSSSKQNQEFLCCLYNFTKVFSEVYSNSSNFKFNI